VAWNKEFGSLFNLLVGGKQLTFGEELQTLGLESFQVLGTIQFVNLVSSRKEGVYLGSQTRSYPILQQYIFVPVHQES
jgi:hypothetical protein